MAKKERQKTEAELEPGFFSDEGYGHGTALRFIDDKKPSVKKSTKNKRTKA